ncbi:MAG: beta-ketoacyl-[acyl-carrier-protein] synthase family protein [Pseudomonadota bacterium]
MADQISGVSITGLGFVTSIGNDKASVLDSLIHLRHGFEKVAFLENPLSVAGTIKGFDTRSEFFYKWVYPAGYDIPKLALRAFSPHVLYAACALRQAIDDARLDPARISGDDTGLFCASGGSPSLLRANLNEMHENRGLRGDPLGVVKSVCGTLNFNLGAMLGIRGANCGFVSACASSSHAIGYACDEIMLGRHRRMLVVGAEEMTADNLLPFWAMRTLSGNPDPDTASRPFDRWRDGFVGTGGAVALVLERTCEALARNAAIYADIAGWGQASDGYHVAIPHPEGSGLATAMKRALGAAGIRAGQVDYINAHATSTQIGDKAEALAIDTVFSAAGAFPAVSSTKALTGHALSMAGAMEAAFCALSLKAGIIPGAAHLAKPDPCCERLNLPTETLRRPLEVAVSNSSGFGGSNVCLVFRNAKR